jgi:type II secretory pathway pseudopilin PulG
MKKRRILISVIIVAVLAAVTSLALYKFLDTNKNKSPGIITATEAEIMDIYLDMLIEHKKFADTIFTDTSNIMEGTGYFWQGWRSED